MGIKKTETTDFVKTINGQRRLKLENIICSSTCNPDDADSYNYTKELQEDKST